jgi:hypothetical protein
MAKTVKLDNLPDVMTGSVKDCRYVTSNFIRGRRLVLYGVGMHFQIENGKIKDVGVEYPCLGPLSRLVQKRTDVDAFKWDGKKWKALTNP